MSDAPTPATTPQPPLLPGDTTATDAVPPRQSPLQNVPTLVWVFTALLVIIGTLAGYVVGTNHGMTQALAARTTTDTTITADAHPESTTPTAETKQQDIPAFDEIKEHLSPGTGPSAPQPDANGNFDATIAGGRGPINSQDDILNIHRRNPQDPFAIGPVDAPVVISEFSDFECPFCSRFANNQEKQIIDMYVKSGYVRMEFNDLPINGPHAVAAAKAGRAAAAQGKFPEFAEALFTASKDVRGHPGFDTDDFVRFAQQAGVPDMERFRKESTDSTYDAAVKKAQQFAGGLGIHATPGFVIGDTYVSGAQPMEVFTRAINDQLNKVAQKKAAK